MLVQHIFRPKQLALAIALSIGYTEISLAQQPETPVVAEVENPKSRAKKPVKADVDSDDIFANKVFIGPKKNAPSRPKKPGKELPGALPLLSTNLPVEFDDAFYQFLEFPENETVDVATTGNAFNNFHEGAGLQGQIDSSAGKNSLILNAVEGGKLSDAANLQHLRVARGEWHLHQELVGHADVQAGVLFNNSSIKGDVHVASNAVYGGYGNSGNVTVEGSLVANTVHGSPIIKGNLTLAEGATYSYGVTPEEFADPVFVEGTAKLEGADFAVYGAPGDYTDTTSKTVLYAKEIEGEFDKVTTNLAFMTPTLQYEKRQVDLTFRRNEVKVESVATSESALGIAREIDQIPNTAAVPVTPPATVSLVAESAGVQAGLSPIESTYSAPSGPAVVSVPSIAAVSAVASTPAATQTSAVASAPIASAAPARTSVSPPPC